MSKALTFEDCLQQHNAIIIMETRRLDFRSMEFTPSFEACNPLRGQYLPLTTEQAKEIILARNLIRHTVYDFTKIDSRKKEDMHIPAGYGTPATGPSSDASRLRD